MEAKRDGIGAADVGEFAGLGEERLAFLLLLVFADGQRSQEHQDADHPPD